MMKGAVPVAILPKLKRGERHCVTTADQESRRKSEIGKTFNFLTINRFDPDDVKYAFVTCVCGSDNRMLAGPIRAGKWKSCGCMQRMRHGFSKSGHRHYMYYRWGCIKNRCFSPQNKDYARYGGRGITMCSRWVSSAENFINDVLSEIGDRPTPLHTLDRSRNEGNYEPGNIRWATRKEQANNREQRKAAIYYAGKS